MDRTIKVQLNPTPEQAQSLKATLEQHTACFNAVALEGFTTQCSNGVELHKRTYYPLRTQYPDLPSQLVCADLCYRKGRFTLHIVVSLPQPIVPPSHEVIGVDLGLNRPAVTSNRHFLGERRWKEQERRPFRLKRKLQAKGTKSAKRHLRKLSGKQFRRHKDHDHVLSKRIVQKTPTGSTLVLENLSTIRETSKMGRGKQNKNVENKRRLNS